MLWHAVSAVAPDSRPVLELLAHDLRVSHRCAYRQGRAFRPFHGTLSVARCGRSSVDAVAVPAKGVLPVGEVPMLPAVAMVECGPAPAIIALVVLVADELLIGAVDVVAVAVAARFVAPALCALVVFEDLRILFFV